MIGIDVVLSLYIPLSHGLDKIHSWMTYPTRTISLDVVHMQARAALFVFSKLLNQNSTLCSYATYLLSTTTTCHISYFPPLEAEQQHFSIFCSCCLHSSLLLISLPLFLLVVEMGCTNNVFCEGSPKQLATNKWITEYGTGG
jgi:hypothetical protein